MLTTLARAGVLALLAGCGTPGSGTTPPTPERPAPTAPPTAVAPPAPIDPWQACERDADCAVVLVDRGACDLCLDTFGVAREHAADAIARYTPTEGFDVCADRHNSCADPAPICVAGVCGLGFEDWRGPTYGRHRVVHPLPPR